jgi:hypothetical protein
VDRLPTVPRSLSPVQLFIFIFRCVCHISSLLQIFIFRALYCGMLRIGVCGTNLGVTAVPTDEPLALGLTMSARNPAQAQTQNTLQLVLFRDSAGDCGVVQASLKQTSSLQTTRIDCCSRKKCTELLVSSGENEKSIQFCLEFRTVCLRRAGHQLASWSTIPHSKQWWLLFRVAQHDSRASPC